jgi:CDP-diacylglycerol--glycerol-3-phosphate 3-phosphatidyltransferase
MKFFFSLPNQLTYLRILLTPVVVFLLFSQDHTLIQWALPVYTLAALTDWYDGWLARRWGYVTRWGTFVDPLADKILTSAVLFSFAALDVVPAWTVWAMVLRDAIITILRSYFEYHGRPFDTSRMAKTKTFAQMALIFYVLTWFCGEHTGALEFAWPTFKVMLDPTLLYVLSSIIAVITVLSGLLYLIDNWKAVEEMLRITKPSANPEKLSGPPPSFLVRFIGSGFWTGYTPTASGTFGSAAGLLLYAIPGFESWFILIPVTLLLYVSGIPIARRMEAYYGHDPAEVTLDEVVGMWITLFFLPKTIPVMIAAFFVFRAMDIIKPFPARTIDNMHGGFGIMTDDVIAAIYANIVLQALVHLSFTRTFFL